MTLLKTLEIVLIRLRFICIVNIWCSLENHDANFTQHNSFFFPFCQQFFRLHINRVNSQQPMLVGYVCLYALSAASNKQLITVLNNIHYTCMHSTAAEVWDRDSEPIRCIRSVTVDCLFHPKPKSQYIHRNGNHNRNVLCSLYQRLVHRHWFTRTHRIRVLFSVYYR